MNDSFIHQIKNNITHHIDKNLLSKQILEHRSGETNNIEFYNNYYLDTSHNMDDITKLV